MTATNSTPSHSATPAGAPTLPRAISRTVKHKTRHVSAAQRENEAAKLRLQMLEASAAAGSPVAAKLLMEVK